jgi:hypothetical protein
MNKILTALCLVLSSSVYAVELNTMEARAAAFLPTGNRFREIYGNVGVSLQIESARISKRHRNMGLWENFEWIFMDGKSLPSLGTTKIDILNLSAGLKFIGYFYNDNFLLNAAIGPNFGLVYIENKLRCSTRCDKPRYRKHSFKAPIGGIVKTSAQYFITKNFYFDLFADYLYLPVHFSRTENCGGFKLGGALGGRF